MNAVKITYIVSSTIGEIFLLTMAVITPIYFTKGFYWWTAFFIFMVIASSHGATARMNSWRDFGNV